MNWRKLELLEQIGLTGYERKALVELMLRGVADAETLCREGAIPTSKIYRAMEKLAQMGLVEIQPTRPKLYMALPGDEVVNRVIEIVRQNAEQFAREARELRAMLSALPGRVRGRTTFVDLALGMESHIKRHVVHLAAAREKIWSYLEHGDLTAIEQVMKGGFPILRRIARNTNERKIDHRVVFGFDYHNAATLMAFLRNNKSHLEQVTGVRYSGELGHPFHIIDGETVILCLDHPFIPEGRFASLLVRDRELERQLSEGFQKLWSKAMRDIRGIGFHPPPPAKQ
jgi:HTH-type transcriptional regulator, sugar sensing transcriptional regulator